MDKTLQIIPIPLLQDNYAYVLHDESENITAVVDPSEEAPIEKFLKGRGWSLDYILNTHHHWDHSGGNLGLKKLYPRARIVGPAYDKERIPGIEEVVDERSGFQMGAHQASILFIPGHTKGHIAFYFPKSSALFCGDTLFSLGCGRLFEGTAEQMWASLSKLMALPDDTLVYAGHEYTLANGKFALTVEPENSALNKFLETARAFREEGKPTLPSRLSAEKACNPFLRARNAEAFAILRQQKDQFRG